MPITVLMLHGHERGWRGVRAAFEAHPDTVVIGEIADPQKAIRLVSGHQPDLVVSAARIENRSTLPALASIRDSCSASLIAVFATTLRQGDIARLARLELAGCFLWSELVAEDSVHAALNAMLTQDLLVCTRSVARDYFYVSRGSSPNQARSVQLSDRERYVLEQLAAGYPQKEIASELHLSRRTIEDVVGRLKAKFEISSLPALVLQAHRLGIID